MRWLPLSAAMPCKTRNRDALKLYNASLSLSKAFSLYCFVLYGNQWVVEKVRDETGRMIALRSAAPYALCADNVEKFFAFPPEQVSAFAIGLAKNMQQAMHYAMYGQAMGHLSDKVFTPRDVQPNDDVKVHLGLTGSNAGKSFMDM